MTPYSEKHNHELTAKEEAELPICEELQCDANIFKLPKATRSFYVKQEKSVAKYFCHLHFTRVSGNTERVCDPHTKQWSGSEIVCQEDPVFNKVNLSVSIVFIVLSFCLLILCFDFTARCIRKSQSRSEKVRLALLASVRETNDRIRPFPSMRANLVIHQNDDLPGTIFDTMDEVHLKKSRVVRPEPSHMSRTKLNLFSSLHPKINLPT